MRVLLLTPPLVDLHTPYPATAYLTGFLRSRGILATQADPGIELALALFSSTGLQSIFEELASKQTLSANPAVKHFLSNAAHYIRAIDPAIRFLQGKDPSLALRLLGRDFFPPSTRANEIWAYENSMAMGALRQFIGSDAFERINEEEILELEDPLGLAFGRLGLQDRARYIASNFLSDIANVIAKGIDPAFGLSRYGEKLAEGSPTFDPIRKRLEGKPTLVDRVLTLIIKNHLSRHNPDVVGITVPFPGNAYGAFRIAQAVKQAKPQASVVLGGGFINTEIRSLSDPKVFDYADYIILDDGEKPMLSLLEHLQGQRPIDRLLRTMMRENSKVVVKTDPREHDIPHRDTGTPTYDGIDLTQYLSVLDVLSPLQRIWTNGRWNKLTLAHGCYWKKCGFCDTSLDYIGRYDPAGSDLLIDRIETLMRETGTSGFHFVDEALPPNVLRALAEKIIERNLTLTWWGNVRFDKAFTPELAQLLARSGCIAVTGGLEVASDRLLKLMQKGVSVEQVAKVTKAFADAGIFVHAYLMYGFPTQTAQDTVESLEYVRQLFKMGCIHSAVWHRFMVTPFSPIGMAPEKYGIRLLKKENASFSNYNLEFEDPTPCDHERLGKALRKALHHYLHQSGLDLDVRTWFAGIEELKPLSSAPYSGFQEAR